MKPIISLSAARSAGLARYFTGRPCRRGHVAERLVSSAMCSACRSEDNASYHQRTRDRQLVRIARNNEARRDEIRSSMRARFHAHPESFVRSHAKRRAAISEGGLDDFTVFVMAEAVLATRRRRAMTGIDWHVDHMVPLSRGGAHAWHNIQVIPAWLNRWKSDRLILTCRGEWVRHLHHAHGLPPPLPLPSPE